MALLSTSHTALFFSKNPSNPLCVPAPRTPPSLSFANKNLNLKPLFSTSKPTLLLPFSSYSESPPDPDLNPIPNPKPDPEPNSSTNPNPGPRPVSITVEWGEKVEPESEYPNVSDLDPPRDEDEWEEEAGYVSGGNGSAAESIGVIAEKDERVEDLKRCLVDAVYGTDFGFRASPEVRAEILELVNQLEALNPTPAPVEASGVEFEEGTLQPPEIKSNIDLPEHLDLFGQKINLLPVQQSLNPLQGAVANISRTISGQPPLKFPIPGNRSRSWLLITYLDEDLRISRGDGGLFVLVKVGSPLLDQ